MKYRNAIISLTLMGAVVLPGCNLIKKVARGDEISRGDLVNEADKQNRKREGKKEDIERYEKAIAEDLKVIEDLRKNGRFSPSDYREKKLNSNLEKLKELDSDNAALASAPKKLASIKSEWTEEIYAKKVLTEQCAEDVADAKEARQEENWRRVESRLTDYVKCRRKLVDVGAEESLVTAQDDAAIAEYDEFMGYIVSKIEEYRKDKQFRYAVGFETSLEDTHLRYYSEIRPDSKEPTAILAKVNKIRKTYRDPEEVKAEKAQAAFDAWREQVTNAFDADWTKIQTAEEAARPAFEEGMAALEKGDSAAAEAKLLEARQTLFSSAYPSSLALDAAYKNGNLEKGLSYEISAGLARTYFENNEKSKLYPELAIIQNGRKWLTKEEEIQVRLFDILADREGKLSPKPTDPVKRYAGRYSDLGKQYKGVKEIADASRGEAYNMLGVAIETLTHRQAGSNTAEKVGQVVWLEEPISLVKGNTLRFDFRNEYKVPTKCWNTKEVEGVNLYTGRVYYKQKCKYKTEKSGYTIVVPAPEGIKVKKGDVVSFYGVIDKRKGDFDVMIKDPGYVRVAPGGETKWFLGAKVK